jgi:uncharacterized membrane protein YjgN (DUF898 family)
MHGKFEFTGTGGSYFWLTLRTGLLTMITLGLYWPAAYAAQQRWIAKNTLIDGKQLVFTGTGMGIFSLWLKILLLSIVTAGIYAPWGWCAIKRWQVSNSYFADPGDIENL